MCGMSRAGAGGAGRGGGSERDGKFVLRSWGGGGVGAAGKEGAGHAGGGHRPGGAGPRGAAPRRRSGCQPRGFALRGSSRPSCVQEPLSSASGAILTTSSARRAFTHRPSTPPESGALAWAGSRAELPLGGQDSRRCPGLGAASRGARGSGSARASGLPTPHPRAEPPRQSALSRPRARPPLPGPQTRPRPGGCARPTRTRFVWFSPRGLFLEFLPFPLFPDLRGPPSRPSSPGPPPGASRHCEPAEFR